ncbi:conserved hypothetical protein [Gammaproteobacteria bacterium]
MDQPPFLFAIPLRSRLVSKDWRRICKLLSQTISSIINQTNPNFHVVVGCHELPELAIPSDPRLVFLQTSTSVPTNLQEQMDDKRRKRRLALAYLRALGGGYVMPVDADDLVSRRIVQYLRTCPPRFGYIINEGYELDYQTGLIKYTPRFNKFCGSSAIFRFSAEDLPLSESDESSYVADMFQNHTKWKDTAEKLGRPLQNFPFCAAVYVTNNSENHSVMAGNVGWKRTILRIFTPARKPSRDLAAEFSLKGACFCANERW